MGLWLSRPRVQDKVAVVSVISSTITTPGGPGGPGGMRGKIKRSVSTAEPSDRRGHGEETAERISAAGRGYTNECNRASIRSDVLLFVRR